MLPGAAHTAVPTRATNGSLQPVLDKTVIGIVGTFDVANFGDLLFPEIAEVELGRRLDRLELRRYSYRRMDGDEWYYPVRSIEDLASEVDELDGLIVGGGHLIRFDQKVAPGYVPPWSALDHPTGYWLTPALVAAIRGVPVIWNAVGASPDTPRWARHALATVLEASDYISVRDEVSARELADVGPDLDVHLVPDTAFAVGRLLDARGVDPESVAEELGVPRPYVVLQPAAAMRPWQDAVQEAVHRLGEQGISVLELAASPTRGDDRRALDLDGPVVRLPDWPDPTRLAALVAGAEAVVTYSLHLSIIALATGVPVVRSQTGEHKYEMLDRFPGVFTLPRDEPVDLTAEILRIRDHRGTAPAVVEMQAQLAAHWDRIAAVISDDDDGRRAQRIATSRRELLRLPEHLRGAEEEADRHARRTVELEAALEHAKAQLTDFEMQLADARRRVSEADRQRQDAERAQRRVEAEKSRLEGFEEDYHRLRQRRIVRIALRFTAVMRPLFQMLRGLRRSVSSGGGATAQPHEPASEEDEARVRSQLIDAVPPTDRTNGPRVSIIILNRDGLGHLRRCLPALAGRTGYGEIEVILVDNSSSDDSVSYAESFDAPFRLEVLRNAENRSFSEANNQGAAQATGELLLFLNNDIEPIEQNWLGHLVDTLESRGAGAVGARLVYPRRPDLDNVGDLIHPDLTLQHRGIHFLPDRDGAPRPHNAGAGEDPLSASASAIREVPAVTAACLLMRRETFERVGGFTEGYVYGTEDVDICLKVREAGESVVYDGRAILWHHEFGTQNEAGREWKAKNRRHNRRFFIDQWGPRLFREVFLDRLTGAGTWSERPLHVGITVTRNDPTAGFGDYYTAHELGDALIDLGWRVSYVERHGDRWYEIGDDFDVVVALLDGYDLRQVPDHVVTVAWVRNWTRRWIEHDWFDDYDIVLASSEISVELIAGATSHSPHLFPLATNQTRFDKDRADTTHASDVFFAGNRWGKEREIEHALPALAASMDVGLYGRGWEDVPRLRSLARGHLDYDDLPGAYAASKIVVDDSALHAKPYGAVNSRVFDALACGALVISNDAAGTHALFDEEFPTWDAPDDLPKTVSHYLDNPEEAARLVERYREQVLAEHTYTRRAEKLRDLLIGWIEAESVGLLIGVPEGDDKHAWGDYHYALAMRKQLEAQGHPTRVRLLADWHEPVTARHDATIHLFGLSEYSPRPSQVNIIWNISHPELVSPELLDRYDLAFVASDRFAAQLAEQATAPVHALHQATDPDRMKPEPGGPEHELLFIGNSRKVRRRIIDDLEGTSHDLAVYGREWTPDLIDQRRVKGEHVPNWQINRYYAAADVVLNDHWDEMREWGFFSNRLYDALAAGAFVVSDHVDGIEEEFDGGVITYTDPVDLEEKLARYLDDPEARREVAERGRKAVLDRHTFTHRVSRILELARPLLDEHGARIVESDRPGQPDDPAGAGTERRRPA
jgi:O-antigen biosynthesis protein